MKLFNYIQLIILFFLLIIIICYNVNKNYHIIEKLGSFTGGYTQTGLFNVNPDNIVNMKIPTNSGELSYEYKYPKDSPCTPDRGDYVPAQHPNGAYCTGKAKVFNIDKLTKSIDYRTRFLGFWKDKNGMLFEIKKTEADGDSKTSAIILRIHTKMSSINDLNTMGVLKPGKTCKPETNSYKGLVIFDNDTKNPKIIFNDNKLKDLHVCIKDNLYGLDKCGPSIIKINLTNKYKESDILFWGETKNHGNDNTVRLYKTYDSSYDTDLFDVRDKYAFKSVATLKKSSYKQTSIDVKNFNLSSECSKPCNDSADCKSFSFIPGTSNTFGKCVFYDEQNATDDKLESNEFQKLYIPKTPVTTTI